MTKVRFDFEKDIDGGREKIPVSVMFAPNRRRVDNGAVVLPQGFSVLAPGSVFEVDLAPTINWCWKVTEVAGSGTTRYVVVPDVEEVDYTDLVDVDPKTLEPDAVPEAAWWTVAGGMQEAHDEAVEASVSALGSASTAAASALAAQGSEEDAEAASTLAVDSRLAAESASLLALQYRNESETAQTGAQTARTGAEAARDIAVAQTFAGSALGTVDLNTITTASVRFQSSAGSLALNYPTTLAGFLETRAMSPTVVSQTYTPIFGGAAASRLVYRRRFYGGVWDSWRPFPAQRIDKTAGIAIYTWDEIANREQLTYGDTGWRDVSSLLSNGWTALTLSLRRTNYLVEVRATGLNPSAKTSDVAFTLPSGFASWNGVADSRSPVFVTTSRSWIASWGSSVVMSGSLTSDPAVSLSASFSTPSNWPTTLPGTAVGAIPNL